VKKKYKQLCQEQRYQIETLLVIDNSKTEIAALMGVPKSTITRELKRNIGTRGRNAKQYIARTAQAKTDQWHSNKNKNIKLTDALKQ
jgi:IS30 family transposase